MSSLPDEDPSLAGYIARFKADVDLTHIFVNGGETEDVITEGGNYPTIAKLVAQNKKALAASIQDSGFAIRNYTFENATTLHIKHNMSATRFLETITDVDGSRIYATIRTVDNSEFVVEFTELTSGSVSVVFCTNT